MSATYFEVHQKIKRCIDGSTDAQRYAKTIIFRVDCRIRVVGMWVVTVAFFQASWLNIFIIKCWRKTKKMQNRV